MIIQTIFCIRQEPSGPALPQPTALLYAAVLAELRAALVLWRYLDTLAGPTATSRNMLACLCPCERRIRVARATLAEAPVICGACQASSNPLTRNRLLRKWLVGWRLRGGGTAVGGEAMRARRPDERLVEVPCMECGARDFEVTRQGWAQGLGDWLRFGGRWRPPRQVCRQCGNASDARSYGALWTARRGWWSVPIQLVQTLRRHRTMVPVPATYLAATLVGAVVGVAVQLVLGWPWWLVAAAVVAAVWLWFAATAFWGAGGWSPSLATDLLRVVRPRLAIERDHRQAVERFRAAPFPLYGLPPAWPGWRHFGGWEGTWAKGQRPVATALSLGHGDPLAGQGPQLRVEVRVEQADTEAVTTELVRDWRGLAEELWLQAAAPADTPAGHVDQLAAARRRPDPAWSEVTIPVEGRPVGFVWLAEGRHWVARAELDDRTLTLHARDLPVGSVELVQVSDLEPYVQGQRLLQAAWARHYDEEH